MYVCSMYASLHLHAQTFTVHTYILYIRSWSIDIDALTWWSSLGTRIHNFKFVAIPRFGRRRFNLGSVLNLGGYALLVCMQFTIQMIPKYFHTYVCMYVCMYKL